MKSYINEQSIKKDDSDYVTIIDQVSYPDIAYLTVDQSNYIVDTGSPYSFHHNKEIILQSTRYFANQSNLMSKLRGHTLRECEGLIGNDITKYYRLWHQVGKDEIVLASREASIVDAMHAIPIQLKHGIPTVQLLIDGSLGRFFLDTGASTTYIRPGFTNRQVIGKNADYAPMYGEFAADMIKTDLELIPIGYKHHTTIGVFPSEVAAQLLIGVDGILGYDILKQYEFVIDLSKQTFYIERKGE